MNMILRDISFPVREAKISGYMLDPDWQKKYGKDENPGLSWAVEVQMEELEVFDDFVAPRILTENVELHLRRWREMEGKTVRFDQNKRGMRAPYASSYFWTHETIPAATLEFVERKDNRFLIRWEGTCSPMYEKPFDRNVPFIIETEAVFKEIGVSAGRGDTDATVRERLAKYIEPDDFIQHPIKETVHDVPVGNDDGFFAPLLRLFRPEKRQWVSRHSLFELRV